MGFYYFSILSIAYGLLLLLFWGVARVTRGLPGRKVLLSVVRVGFLVLPVAEVAVESSGASHELRYA
jgi:hypothetical protein